MPGIDDEHSDPGDSNATQSGIDVPGEQASLTDFINSGVFNGNFRIGAPDPAAAITLATSVSASNFMPGWRLVSSSNFNQNATQLRDTASPSGSNLSFFFNNTGAASDEIFVEQIVDIGGSRVGGFPDSVRAFAIAAASNGGTFSAKLALQYLTTDGSIVGMPAEQTTTSAIAAGATATLEVFATTGSIAPPAARYLRVRAIALRGGAATNVSGFIAFSEVRRQHSSSKAEFTASGTWTKPVGASWVQVVLVGGGGGGGSGRKGAASTNRGGGGGAGGAAMSTAIFAASDLPATVTVTIGAAGAGGAAIGTINTDGNPGVAGGATSFGSLLTAVGGGGGNGGTTAGGSAGATGSGMYKGALAGAGSTGAGATGAAESGGGLGGAGGGGGGGGVTAGDVAGAGGNGSVPVQVSGIVTAAAGGTADSGTAGAAGAAFGSFGGGGGGGGGGGLTMSSGAGGAGARGGGGGGGGAALNSFTARAGGAGGAGYCAVTSW